MIFYRGWLFLKFETGFGYFCKFVEYGAYFWDLPFNLLTFLIPNIFNFSFNRWNINNCELCLFWNSDVFHMSTPLTIAHSNILSMLFDILYIWVHRICYWKYRTTENILAPVDFLRRGARHFSCGIVEKIHPCST